MLINCIFINLLYLNGYYNFYISIYNFNIILCIIIQNYLKLSIMLLEIDLNNDNNKKMDNGDEIIS